MNCPLHSSCQFGSVCRVEFCTDYSVAVLANLTITITIINATTTAATAATNVAVTISAANVTGGACVGFGSVNTFANY